jgi:photosystem II stability/assembly factor-like uncharacterized protein
MVTAGIAAGASLQFVSKLPKECGTAVSIVQFTSRQVGWCGDRMGILKTTDGGRTWRSLQLPVKTTPLDFFSSELYQLQMLSPLNGWVRKWSGWYWTQDGGSSWTERPLPLGPKNEGDSKGEVDYVYFAAPQIGWALGMREVPGDPLKERIRYRVADEHSVFVPALFRTDDGGLTWTEQAYPDLKLLPDRLEFADIDHGLSIEMNATLYTTDSGRHWEESRYCSTVAVKALHQAGASPGLFLGTAAQLLDAEFGWWSVEGDIFRTTDGGVTWCQLPSIRYRGHIVSIERLRFANRKLGWAVPSFLKNGGTLPVYQTTNGGESWNQVRSPRDAGIEGCSDVSDATVFCWGYGRLYRLVND